VGEYFTAKNGRRMFRGDDGRARFVKKGESDPGVQARESGPGDQTVVNNHVHLEGAAAAAAPRKRSGGGGGSRGGSRGGSGGAPPTSSLGGRPLLERRVVYEVSAEGAADFVHGLFTGMRERAHAARAPGSVLADASAWWDKAHAAGATGARQAQRDEAQFQLGYSIGKSEAPGYTLLHMGIVPADWAGLVPPELIMATGQLMRSMPNTIRDAESAVDKGGILEAFKRAMSGGGSNGSVIDEVMEVAGTGLGTAAGMYVAGPAGAAAGGMAGGWAGRAAGGYLAPQAVPQAKPADGQLALPTLSGAYAPPSLGQAPSLGTIRAVD
jgi:hypothetical protein